MAQLPRADACLRLQLEPEHDLRLHLDNSAIYALSVERLLVLEHQSQGLCCYCRWDTDSLNAEILRRPRVRSAR